MKHYLSIGEAAKAVHTTGKPYGTTTALDW